METIYEKKKTSEQALMEYYWFYEHRDHLRNDWKEEDEKLKQHCDTLYAEFEELYRQERQREETVEMFFTRGLLMPEGVQVAFMYSISGCTTAKV